MILQIILSLMSSLLIIILFRLPYLVPSKISGYICFISYIITTIIIMLWLLYFFCGMDFSSINLILSQKVMCGGILR
jgi:hypothetical protein